MPFNPSTPSYSGASIETWIPVQTNIQVGTNEENQPIYMGIDVRAGKLPTWDEGDYNDAIQGLIDYLNDHPNYSVINGESILTQTASQIITPTP